MAESDQQSPQQEEPNSSLDKQQPVPTREIPEEAVQLTQRNREVLELGDKYIYSEDTVQEIRTRFQNDRVIVVDANNVLCDDDEQSIRVNPNAAVTLKALQDLSYTLILWSSASKKYINGLLENHNLREYFNMVIAGENYLHHDVEMGQDKFGDPIYSEEPRYKEAVRSTNTKWLTDDDKEYMLRIPGSTKTPFVLFREACILDDNNYMNSLLLSNETKKRYPGIYNFAFPAQSESGLRELALDVVPEVVKIFPPQAPASSSGSPS